MKLSTLVLVPALAFSLMAFANDHESPLKKASPLGSAAQEHGDDVQGSLIQMKIAEGAAVEFKNLKKGAEVKANTPFVVKFGIKGMKIKPAGELLEGTGHHHLTIDSPAVEQGMPVPTDDKHIHYGKGQTEGEITLAPGKHTLTLQFANGAHLSYGPQLSKTIEVTAK